MLLSGRTSLFRSLAAHLLSFSSSLFVKMFCISGPLWQLIILAAAASAICMATHHPYIWQPLFSLMHCFQICPGAFVSSRLPQRITAKPLPLTHTSLKMQK